MEDNKKLIPKFNVQYAGHETRVTESIRFCLSKKEFLDVTLICDNHVFSVHKIMLSSLSPYFYNILKNETAAHPKIILDGVPFEIMTRILMFMYTGEVNVETEYFDKFMSTLNKFEISVENKITVQTQKTEEIETNKETLEIKEEQETKPIKNELLTLKTKPKVKKEVKKKIKTIKNEVQNKPVDREPSINYKQRKLGSTADRELLQSPLSFDFDNSLYSLDEHSYSSLFYSLRKRESTEKPKPEPPGTKSAEKPISNKLSKKGTTHCLICNKIFLEKLMNRHMKIHSLGDYFFNCDVCGKVLKTKRTLNNHRNTFHGLRPNVKPTIKV